MKLGHSKISKKIKVQEDRKNLLNCSTGPFVHVPRLDFCTSPFHSDGCVEPDSNDVPCRTEQSIMLTSALQLSPVLLHHSISPLILLNSVLFETELAFHPGLLLDCI